MMVGQMLYGFCGGWFGRDSYSNKRVEAVGVDWVVAREEDSGMAVFAMSRYGRDHHLEWDIHKALAEYTQDPDTSETNRWPLGPSDNSPTPWSPTPTPYVPGRNCSACGLQLHSTMGYVCPRTGNCPVGLASGATHVGS